MGPIHLHGVDSQYDLVGSLHCDYDDDVNKKVPGERLQSIILALDPFKLLYELRRHRVQLVRWVAQEPLVRGSNPSGARVQWIGSC
jgi:hypothetical protein